MAETVVLVCDVCGKAAAETVTIRTQRGNALKDLCAPHVEELLRGTRKPRRGRPRKAATAPASTPVRRSAASARRGRPRSAAKAKTAAKAPKA
ncbi:MAG: hypothetical protein KatS3mg013_2169 [Actinomycetota bacterium]|jgi:hypothetical protein|nr:MAG: hypothetical protein KatS3mg013_2169 [Actinomycetota bacterium]